MVSHYLQAAIGLAFLIAGLSGPFSYADDWRHPGEIAAAIGFVLSGLSLTLPIIFSQPRWTISSRWAASLVLLGLVVGTVADMAVLGVTVGFVVGFAVARHQRLPPNNSFKPNRLRRSA